jgi:glycogen phosphorylase
MPLRKYIVVPPMEGGLENLREIAANLWFSWNSEAEELFQHLDEQLWKETNHNPLQVLISLSRNRLRELRGDEGYRSYAGRVYQRFLSYMERTGPYDHHLDRPVDFTTALFSMEFGLAECLPIYSGGLGLMAGDHLKSASDLNLPAVGVGLLYQEGYFRQSLSAEVGQEEHYPRTEFDTLPLEKVTDESGAPMRIEVELDNESIWLRVHRGNVGRVPLVLLDADLPENSPRLRRTTARLYGGDEENRIRQQLVLGIGGVRALQALGIRPEVFHLNESHGAFGLLERMRHFMDEEGLSRVEAASMVMSQSILTLHGSTRTPDDVFDRSLMEKYCHGLVQKLGMDFEDFMGLGRIRPKDQSEGFCMPVLGIRMACRTTGISRLHSRVVRKLWRGVWPSADLEDVPIGSVSNGVHVPSHISRELSKLYDRYLGPGWTEDPDSEKIWERTENIPDTELWRTHDRSRTRLVSFARERVVKQLKSKGATPDELEEASKALDPEALTVCFVSRFAAHQRATLLLRDPERLATIVADRERPVQFIISGKAHPADQQGKEQIRSLWEASRKEPFRNRIVFIEDYDLNVARNMAEGADVWLSTSRRPQEAGSSGGMKAAANGALNLSVLAGWWDEGFQGENGWVIGWGEEYENLAYQDQIESKALYDILDDTVKTIFYDRSVDDLPREWIRMMKRSISTICPVFNSHRMVCDYIEDFYIPAARSSAQLQADNYVALKNMVDWKEVIKDDWDKISVNSVVVRDEAEALKGRQVQVVVGVETSGHQPEELNVELLHGPIDLWDNFKVRHVTRLAPENQARAVGSEQVLFSGWIPLSHAGLYGYVVQVTPEHPNLPASRKVALIHRG